MSTDQVSEPLLTVYTISESMTSSILGCKWVGVVVSDIVFVNNRTFRSLCAALEGRNTSRR
jgi:hypothetical protein